MKSPGGSHVARTLVLVLGSFGVAPSSGAATWARTYGGESAPEGDLRLREL